jgi:hypothetical protein
MAIHISRRDALVLLYAPQKMNWHNPQEKAVARGPASHARRDSDDLRFECRFPKVLNSRDPCSQNIRLFKLPTQFAR